jgi:hypothetical protein
MISIDKIKNGIGEKLYSHLNTLSALQLRKQKVELEAEMQREGPHTERAHKLRLEMEFIKHLLN